jgi:peptidoglycan lytic transglycosylase
MAFRLLCTTALLFAQMVDVRARSVLASTYGYEGGRQTASGARYNPHGLTVAHRKLPFGTCLMLSHGSRKVRVTVNDRGPFVGGRELDLSTGAARALSFSGVGRVGMERCS